MWKRGCFVTLVICAHVLSKAPDENVIDTLASRLGAILDYLSQNYYEINADCLFGVVLAGAMLEDTISAAGAKEDHVRALYAKTKEIYRKSVPVLKQDSQWDNFTKYIVLPELWRKPIKYKLENFKTHPNKRLVKAIFSEKPLESFSDHCISLIINSTLDLKPNSICTLSAECEKFLEHLEKGSGYILTHKLLIMQIARARKCDMDPKVLSTSIRKMCQEIYTEIVSVEYFLKLERVFDLFLEQSLLCGYEGFADFLKIKWLERIFGKQRPSGCFPLNRSKSKREANVWRDGCVDHTSGLGAAVLSLYLNYLIRNECPNKMALII